MEDICTEINHLVSATVKSRFSNYQKNLDFYVLSRITKKISSLPINRTALEIPKNIFLADPEFHKPSDVDILIGVQLFCKLLCVGQIELKDHPNTLLQKTQLGWIVAGEINSPFTTSNVQCNLTMHSAPLDVNLTRFWEIEELPSSKVFSAEEKACEAYFKNNTQRDSKGRYIVKLPFNEERAKLGDSLPMAARRFTYLEHRFEKKT